MVSSLSLALGFCLAAAPDLVPAAMVGPYFQVTAQVNGKPLKFIVDTGAGLTVLTPQGALAAGIKGGTPVRASGAGGKTIPAQLVKVDSVRIGQSEVTGEQAVVLELPPALRCDGLVGYSFLRKFVTTFDYSASTLTFASPTEFQPHPDDRSADLIIKSNHPHIRATAAGREGFFVFDTGAGGALTLHTPFVEANKLRENLPIRMTRITGKGVGGYVRGDVTTLPEVSIAGFKLPAVPVVLASPGTGAMSASDSFGNIGSEIISRFIMTLDYGRGKAWFRPSPLFNSPYHQDKSGLFIDFDESRSWIADVVPGSPADLAGVKVDDEVGSINGVKVSEWHPLDVRKPFRGPVGSKVTLVVKRGGREMTVVIELRDL